MQKAFDPNSAGGAAEGEGAGLRPASVQTTWVRARRVQEQLQHSRGLREAARSQRARSAQSRRWTLLMRMGSSGTAAEGCRIYAWGYGLPQCGMLREQRQPTAEAWRFAVERGWDAARTGAWAREITLPLPLSVALAVLEPSMRRDAAVAGYGGRTVRSGILPHAFLPARTLPEAFASAARGAISGLAPDCSREATGGSPDLASAARAGGQSRFAGTLLRSERLTRRASSVVAETRTLCQVLATRVEYARELRLQGAQAGGNGTEDPRRCLAEAPPAEKAGTAASDQPRMRPGRPRDGELKLPDPEFAALNQVVRHAHELAAAGRLAAGYGLLLAGQHRAAAAAAVGVDRAHDLFESYCLALDNYVRRYGLKLG